MRKLSAILLIGIFAFSQYARQFSYLGCELSNTFRTDTAKCDCEKKAGFNDLDNNQPASPKIHTHIHLDEFFSPVKEIIIDPPSKAAASGFHNRSAGPPCEVTLSRPWQPPNTRIA